MGGQQTQNRQRDVTDQTKRLFQTSRVRAQNRLIVFQITPRQPMLSDIHIPKFSSPKGQDLARCRNMILKEIFIMKLVLSP